MTYGSVWEILVSISGAVFAGGLQLALHSDLRLALQGARMGMTITQIGRPSITLIPSSLLVIGPSLSKARSPLREGLHQ